mgnify:FL=1
MTTPLYGYAPEDVTTALVAWLTPLRRTADSRGPNDPLPSTVVEHITGAEDSDAGVCDQVVSVHTFVAKSAGTVVLRDEAAKTHRRMLLLNDRPQITIGTRLVSVDYVEVVEPQIPVFYSDTVIRKVGRYRVGLPYVAV